LELFGLGEGAGIPFAATDPGRNNCAAGEKANVKATAMASACRSRAEIWTLSLRSQWAEIFSVFNIKCTVSLLEVGTVTF
jgi:hypothetical protein